MNPMLKNALELGPILIWVVLNWLLKGVDTNLGSGQTLALIIFIGLSLISVAWLWLAERKTPWLPLVSAAAWRMACLQKWMIARLQRLQSSSSLLLDGQH